MSKCPAESQLIELLGGELSTGQFENVVSHIDECHRCQESIERLDEVASPLTTKVRNAIFGQMETFAKEEELQSAINGFLKSVDQIDREPLSFLDSGSHSNSKRNVLGDFRIIRELGRGSMGVVYEAEQISLGRRVALKVHPFAALLDERRKKRFQNEARAAASLDHPHIVTVHAIETDRGVHYYAMQYIDGPNLAEILANHRGPSDPEKLAEVAGRNDSNGHGTELGDPDRIPDGSTVVANYDVELDGPDCGSQPESDNRGSTQRLANCETISDETNLFDFKRIADLTFQAAQALAYAHQNGVIHRDVKPSNMIIDATGHLWVTDFGLAHIETDANLTLSGDIIGTLNYMSPEQASGRNELVDRRTDIYSLGATLYELLTLRPLFQKSNREQILLAIADEEPEFPRKINPAIPVDLETIVLKSIAKKVEERYATADEMAEDLNRFLNKTPILAKRPNRFERLIKWTQRHRRLAATLFVSMIGLTATVGILAGVFSTQNAQLRTTLSERDEIEGKLNRALATSEENRKLALTNSLIAQNSAYAANFRLAFDQFEKQDPISCANMLNDLVPQQNQTDVRGFEWNLLQQSLSNTEREVAVCEKALYTVALSNDGKTLATSGEDATVYIFNVKRMEVDRKIATGQIEVNDLAFSPNDSILASAGDDGSIKLWNTVSGEHIRSIETGFEKAFGVQFILDGAQLVSSGNDNNIHLWDVATGNRVGVLTGHKDAVTALAIDTTGTFVAAASRSSNKSNRVVDLRIWNVANSSLVSRYDIEPSLNRIDTLSFAPDGKHIVSGHRSGIIARWSLLEHRHQILGSRPDAISSLVFYEEDPHLLATDKAGVVSVWKYRSANEPATQSTLISNQQSHVGRIYDSLVIPQTGKSVTVGSDGTLNISKARVDDQGELSVQELKSMDDDQRDVGITVSNEAMAIYGNHEIRLYQLHNGRFELHASRRDSHIRSVCLSNDGRTLMTGDDSGRISIRDVNTLEKTSSWLVEEDVTIDEIALTSKADIVGIHLESNDVAIQLFDVATKTRLPTPHIKTGESICFSHDDQWFAFTELNDLYLWNLNDSSQNRQLKKHASTIKSIAFDPLGRYVATGSDDRSIILWDLKTGHVARELSGHLDSMYRIAFTPDGRTLVSSGSSHGMKIWHVATGQHLMDYRGQSRAIIAFPSNVPAMLTFRRERIPLVTYFERNWNPLSKTERQAFGLPP